MPIRCPWTGTDEQMIRYHDTEWGVPVHDDRLWLEHIILDTFQAGLSWRTVLHKREAFREVFHNFNPQKIAAMTEKEMEAARQNQRIIRNRQKIQAAVKNASRFIHLIETYGSFSTFIWSFTGGKVIQNRWQRMEDVPANTPLSDKVSNALKQEGFSFVGSTICYAFLQAGGVINDHLITCFRHEKIATLRLKTDGICL